MSIGPAAQLRHELRTPLNHIIGYAEMLLEELEESGPRDLVAGLVVDAARMRANLEMTNGLIVSEAVMMGLGPALGRQRAHDLVYDICRKVVATGRPLLDLLAEDVEIGRHISRAELARLTDPARYLGLAGEMIDRVLARESQA